MRKENEAKNRPRALVEYRGGRIALSSENRNLYEDIVGRREKISLVGLGYVGMPIAVSFSKRLR